jgi:hypothetical protein
MNGLEQRQHRTVTDSLAARLDAVEVALHALDDLRVVDSAAIRAALDRECTSLRHEVQTLEAMIRGLRDRTRWQRLRWLLTGA